MSPDISGPLIRETLGEIYNCFFEERKTIDDMYKAVTKAMEFLMVYCCGPLGDTEINSGATQTSNPEVKSNNHSNTSNSSNNTGSGSNSRSTIGGNKISNNNSMNGMNGNNSMNGNNNLIRLSAMFSNDKLQSMNDLSKSSSMYNIITIISKTVSDYTKINTASSLHQNCVRYYNTIEKSRDLIRYDFAKLSKLLFIMEEFISYNNINYDQSFNWAVTSFVFHILFCNLVTIIRHSNVLTNSINRIKNNNSVDGLSKLFQSKNDFVNKFLLEIVPKILSFSLTIKDGVVTYKSVPIKDDVSRPIYELLVKYREKRLTPNDMKAYIILHSSKLVKTISDRRDGRQHINNITNNMNNSIVVGGDNTITPIAKDLGVTIPDSINPTSIANTLNTVSNTTSSSKKPKQSPGKLMPEDDDFKKFVIMKFLSILESCIKNISPNTGNFSPPCIKSVSKNNTLSIIKNKT